MPEPQSCTSHLHPQTSRVQFTSPGLPAHPSSPSPSCSSGPGAEGRGEVPGKHPASPPTALPPAPRGQPGAPKSGTGSSPLRSVSLPVYESHSSSCRFHPSHPVPGFCFRRDPTPGTPGMVWRLCAVKLFRTRKKRPRRQTGRSEPGTVSPRAPRPGSDRRAPATPLGSGPGCEPSRPRVTAPSDGAKAARGHPCWHRSDGPKRGSPPPAGPPGLAKVTFRSRSAATQARAPPAPTHRAQP